MKKTIKLTESELINLVKRVINEQSVAGAPNNGMIKIKPEPKAPPSSLLPCVPTAFKLSIQDFIKKNYNKTFLKAALGIIGRESDFGESNRFKFTSLLKSISAAFGADTSVGYGQIKPSTAAQFGLTTDDLEMASGSVNVSYKIIERNYNIAIKNGFTDQPSVNLVGGTGNSALDMAIAGYNLGESKIVKYCKTNDPKVNKPCSMAGKIVEQLDIGDLDYREPKTVKKYTVTNQYVQNYIPNFKTKRWDGVNISSHGYILEVAKRIKGFTCF